MGKVSRRLRLRGTLRLLTLHGNGIKEAEAADAKTRQFTYVAFVLRHLPQLRKLDCSVVTESDRRCARLRGAAHVDQLQQLWMPI